MTKDEWHRPFTSCGITLLGEVTGKGTTSQHAEKVRLWVVFGWRSGLPLRYLGCFERARLQPCRQAAENTFALQRLRGALSGGRHLVCSLFSRKGASRKLLWYKP